MNTNNSNEKKPKKNTTMGELIMAECASVADVYVSFT